MEELLLSDAFDMYRDNYIRFKNQSIRTEEQHETCKKSLLAFIGDKPIDELGFMEIRSWKYSLDRKVGQNTVRGYVLKLRSVVNYCNSMDIPCIKVDNIPVPKRAAVVPSFLTAEEVARMIDCACNIRTKFVVSLLYSSGIRLSELISLNRNQIVDRRFTVIGKGGKPRLCFIDERTESLMNEYLSHRTDYEDALVVSFLYEKRMTATNIQLMIRNAGRAAGLNKKVHPHIFRHSYATNFLKNNGNMRYLSVLLGHASLDTTAMYAHVVDNDLEEQYKRFHTV